MDIGKSLKKEASFMRKQGIDTLIRNKELYFNIKPHSMYDALNFFRCFRINTLIQGHRNTSNTNANTRHYITNIHQDI